MPSWNLPGAPAVLLGATKWLGLSAAFLDFNKDPNGTVSFWAEQILAFDPEVVALSVFTYKSKPKAQELVTLLKQLNPKITIVAGGSGIKDSINGKVAMTADVCIEGDGEVQWPKFLTEFFGIDRQLDFTPMTAPYLPYYGDYDVNFYKQEAEKVEQPIWVPISGSRGCVRKCTFCEIHEHWKFSQRAPKSIAAEIEQILTTFDHAHIHFTDSLVNGSLPAFYELLDHLIEIKQRFPKFSWGSQFIIRNASQSNEDYWRKIAASGNIVLEIGVETGSDNLRQQMKKNFTNADLDHSLEYMDKLGLRAILLMFVGYPTETLDDFHQTLAMLERYKHLVGKTIIELQAGYNLSIHPGTPLYTTSRADPNMILTKEVGIWYNKSNPTLTAEERVRRRKQLQEVAVSLGYTMTYDNTIAIKELEGQLKRDAIIIDIVERKIGKNS
jgi:radical SAM superfamily enzyme YgiQ (UPF0313 family)